MEMKQASWIVHTTVGAATTAIILKMQELNAPLMVIKVSISFKSSTLTIIEFYSILDQDQVYMTSGTMTSIQKSNILYKKSQEAEISSRVHATLHYALSVRLFIT